MREISGIYICTGKENICFEDLDKSDQYVWLNTLDKDALMRLAIKLGDTIRDLGNQFDISSSVVE